MARRSWKFWFLAGLLMLVAAVALAVALRTGPAASRAATGDRATGATAELPGVQCESRSVAVKLSADDWRSYKVAGALCWTGALKASTLLVTVSGAGYDSVYWDFPYQPERYSFVRAALDRGFAVFNFDRLGMGDSDRPFGLSLGVDNQAYVLAQLVDTLTEAHDFAAVVTVGHSFGSTITLAHALSWPAAVDGIVLTGFVHNSNPGFNLAMRDGVDLAAFKGPFAGRVIDPTYIISKPDSRGDIFYSSDNVDPAVIEVDEQFRQTTTIGEVISMPKYFKAQSRALTVPAFTLIGEDDFVVCGGAVDCTDHAAIRAWESDFFPPAACHEIVVVNDTNHNANLHRNAPDNFALMLDWVERRIGNRAPPVQPCG